MTQRKYAVAYASPGFRSESTASFRVSPGNRRETIECQQRGGRSKVDSGDAFSSGANPPRKAEVCIRLLSVDSHPVFRKGIAQVVDSQHDMALVAQASSGQEAIQCYREHRPDLTLMEARLPDANGIDVLIAIRTEFPSARIIMFTTFEGDVEVLRALEAGASGYLLKNMPPGELLQAIRQVYAGRKHIPPELAAQLVEYMGNDNLTAREVEVLMQIAEGHRNRDIGERLCISEQTVKVHIRHIVEKLGAKDRTEAITIGMRRGIIRLT
jgi:DNA-binding NarL/FixJ family response regulator